MRVSKFENALNEVLQDDESGQTEQQIQQEFEQKQRDLIDANLKRDYKLAQKINNELELLAELRKEKKAEAVERLHAQERRAIELYFDKQCKELVSKYSKQIENFAKRMDEAVTETKLKHENEINQLTDALKHSYPKVGVNKELLNLRQLEFSLASERRFMEADEVKDKISELEKDIINKKNKEKLEHDMASMNELKQTHKKEIDRMINKMVLEKERLYTRLKRELKSLENWKFQQQKKIEVTHQKDLEQTKAIVNRQIRMSLFNQASRKQNVNDNTGARSSVVNMKNLESDRSDKVVGSYRSSIVVPWVQETIKEMTERLKTVNSVNNDLGKNICDEFVQFDLDGKLEPRHVNVTIDDVNKKLIYKTIGKKFKFEFHLKDVIDVEYPFKVNNTNPKHGFKIVGRKHDLFFVGKDKQSVLALILQLTGNAQGPRMTKQFFNIKLEDVQKDDAAN